MAAYDKIILFVKTLVLLQPEYSFWERNSSGLLSPSLCSTELSNSTKLYDSKQNSPVAIHQSIPFSSTESLKKKESLFKIPMFLPNYN